MKLNLKNPLVFFDLETTGTNINTDRIVEICYLKVYPNGNEEAKTLRINPEIAHSGGIDCHSWHSRRGCGRLPYFQGSGKGHCPRH